MSQELLICPKKKNNYCLFCRYDELGVKAARLRKDTPQTQELAKKLEAKVKAVKNAPKVCFDAALQWVL